MYLFTKRFFSSKLKQSFRSLHNHGFYMNKGSVLIKDDPYLNRYRMQSNPRGHAIIINNVNYGGLKIRKGSDADAASLKKIFQDVHFDVSMKRDLESYGIFDAVREMSSKDHSKLDAFVCCILAHGSENAVYGIDRKEIQIRDVINLFKGTHCKSLAGKPKLFFVQACQGDDEHAMVRSERDDISTGYKYVPNEADMLLALSTVPGYYSYRNEVNGSWFIQSLVENFAENYKKTHLTDILTLVSYDVSKGEQMPIVISTLRKHLYF